MVRVTLQGLAAVLGGTQSLHTNSFDEALCLPTENAVKIALRTQQIIAHESGVTDTVDPLAGSYYVEWLTNKMDLPGADKKVADIMQMLEFKKSYKYESEDISDKFAKINQWTPEITKVNSKTGENFDKLLKLINIVSYESYLLIMLLLLKETSDQHK
ncbi:unnamed protein product [marine sediment metagenome]|uniref:Methylmalonyl-CoA mutase alpha/beta chain catalytic domain-containing protein n=1 Tax=marine sediment metagenome TaxID=412755 RepID=X1ALL4_9ZZZZ